MTAFPNNLAKTYPYNPMSHPLRWLVLVLLEEPHMPATNDVAEQFAGLWQGDPEMTVSKSTESLFSCTVGQYTAAVTLVPRPVPWMQLEGPCATAWAWPAATEDLKDHQAHLLVALVDEGGDAIGKSIALTQLVSSLLKAPGVLGVFWGPGRHVIAPQTFLEQASRMDRDDLPLFLWVDFRVELEESGNCRLYTTGLGALGKAEIEIPQFSGELQQMVHYAYNVAHYQLTKPNQIKDGDTFGLTEKVQAVAHPAPSMFDPHMKVIQLEFPPSPE